jgi:hypothetical protein
MKDRYSMVGGTHRKGEGERRDKGEGVGWMGFIYR